MTVIKETQVMGRALSRRGFITSAAVALVALSAPSVASATVKTALHRQSDLERSLAFTHLHTGERLKLTYWSGGQYIDESLAEINKLLRDFRTGEHFQMDTALIDTLHQLQVRTGNHQPFEIISGYRSPKTNAMLRKSSNGVAKKSLHMLGQAIDVRLPGTELKHLHKAALDTKQGGVGLYTGSNFLHLDTGRVRSWGS